MDVKYSLTHWNYDSMLPGNAGYFTIKEIFGRSDKASIMWRLPESAPRIYHYRGLKLILGQPSNAVGMA